MYSQKISGKPAFSSHEEPNLQRDGSTVFLRVKNTILVLEYSRQGMGFESHVDWTFEVNISKNKKTKETS